MLMHINGTCQYLGCQRKCFENIIIMQDLEVVRSLYLVENSLILMSTCQTKRLQNIKSDYKLPLNFKLNLDLEEINR